MPSSGRIAAISCIPPVSVEPIPPPLNDMAWMRDLLYCRREFLMKGPKVREKLEGALVARCYGCNLTCMMYRDFTRNVNPLYINVIFVTIDTP